MAACRDAISVVERQYHGIVAAHMLIMSQMGPNIHSFWMQYMLVHTWILFRFSRFFLGQFPFWDRRTRH